MMLLQNEFEIGDTVYLKTDASQLPRVVTSIRVFPSQNIAYELTNATTTSGHYGFEITKEKNILVEG